MRRRSRAAVAGAALSGLLVGVVITLAATEPRTDAGGTTPTRDRTAATESSVTLPTTDVRTDDATLLTWTSGGLADGFAKDVIALDGADEVTVVRGDEASLLRSVDRDGTVVDDVADGWTIPIDTLAIDPASFAAFADASARAAVTGLRPGQALLTESSRRLRKLDVGSQVELRGATLEISGVVDDVSGAGAELIVHADDAAAIGAVTERYLLVRHESGARRDLTREIGDLASGRTIRLRSAAETTWLRHGDAVAPQLFVKLAYGEFAVRDVSGRGVEVDPEWVEEHIVVSNVPILGPVRCHRAVVGPLDTAMRALADENLGHLVDPGAFAGCWSPRRIDDEQPLSRHAWGIALDLNITGNPRGSFSSQDPRLVDAMRAAGFTWGGTWLVPDPGHYELVPA